MDDGVSFGLNFLIILFGFIDEGKDSLCTSESLRKYGMA